MLPIATKKEAGQGTQVSLRMSIFSSDIYTTPLVSVPTPVGWRNKADSPKPFCRPAVPLPAIVVTRTYQPDAVVVEIGYKKPNICSRKKQGRIKKGRRADAVSKTGNATATASNHSCCTVLIHLFHNVQSAVSDINSATGADCNPAGLQKVGRITKCGYNGARTDLPYDTVEIVAHKQVPEVVESDSNR